MRKCIPLFIYLIFITHARAQDVSGNLTIPSTPAFSILNYEPTSVMRPATFKDISTDVLNSFDKSGKLLMNLGLEVSPYWLESHSTLNRYEYLHPGLAQTFLQSFNISAATVKDSSSGNNNFGIGFRFKVLNGKPVKQQDSIDGALKRVRQIILIIEQIKVVRPVTVNDAIQYIAMEMAKKKYSYSNDTIGMITKEGNNIASRFSNDSVGISKFSDTLANIVQTKFVYPIAQAVATITDKRTGLILEFAGASAFDNSINNEVERIGVWANLSDYVSDNNLFTLTLRYMYHNNDTSVSNFDAGLSYLKKLDKYNFSLEYMLRWSQAQFPSNVGQTLTQSNFSYRLAFQTSYTLSSQISVNLSIGKDFNTPYITSNAFFSLLGLNYSIFRNQLPVNHIDNPQ